MKNHKEPLIDIGRMFMFPRNIISKKQTKEYMAILYKATPTLWQVILFSSENIVWARSYPLGDITKKEQMGNAHKMFKILSQDIIKKNYKKYIDA